MKILDSLKNRRSYYNIDKNIPVKEEVIYKFIEDSTEIVPDAFNMKSSRVIVVTGDKQDELWDNIYDVFEGKVPREKIDSFKNGYGTILYFYDKDVVENYKREFESYKDKFEMWALQASAMLQITIWSGLRELGIGASLQHYDPIIDDMVREMFDIGDSYILNAQMPFGGILEEPDAKDKEDISKRVKIFK